MSKISLSYQQHRQIIGNHTNWQDRKQGSQRYQNDCIERLARKPGRHTGIIHRQDTAHAVLHLMITLCSIQNCNCDPIIIQRPDNVGVNKTRVSNEAYCAVSGRQGIIPSVTPRNEYACHRSLVPAEQVFPKILPVAHSETHTVSVIPNMNLFPFGFPFSSTAHFIVNPLIILMNSVVNVFSETDQLISQYDPLKLSGVMAFPENSNAYIGDVDNEQFMIEDKEGNRIPLYPVRYAEKSARHEQRFAAIWRRSLKQYYEKYHSKYPPLRTLAKSILKEKIQKRFHLDLDPDKACFMHFDNTMYNSKGKIHFAPPHENKTLTECLFTNFDAETQDSLQDMDAMCGIYDISLKPKKEYHASDELKIKPSKFIKLVYDIDFYNYAKRKLTDSFRNKGAHIKKYFIDFVNHLDISHLNDKAVNDVLNGVGILKKEKVQVSLFDIKGYRAFNAFLFRNKNGRVTLYLPGSDIKFISFRGDFEMRSWIVNACATKKHRDMIASHFTIANLRDGVFYYGVKAWLNFINQDNDLYDKIAIKPMDIPSEYFFEYLFYQIKYQIFSDLDSLIKSDAEVRRDMWEKMIDASNIIPNPVSPFLSLGMHLEHAIEADTYKEAVQEWNQVTSDIVNIVTMVLLSKVMQFPDTEGYQLINIVKEGVETESKKAVMKVSEISSPIHADVGPESPSWAWLFNEQPENNIIQYHRPLTRFLPLQEVRLVFNSNLIENTIENFLTIKLRNYPYDIFYGFSGDYFQIPQYIRNIRSRLKINLNSAKELLEKTYYRLVTPAYGKHIKQYFSTALGVQDESILIEAILRFRIQVKRAKSFLAQSEAEGYSNIGIISTRQIAEEGNPFSFRSAITDMNILKAIPAGFTIQADLFRRIFIMNDGNPELDPSGQNIFGTKSCFLDGVILHEVSHTASYTLDYHYNQLDPTMSHFGDAPSFLNLFNEALKSGILKETPSFEHFMTSVYQHLGINALFDKDVALNMVRRDPMLKANLMLDNADSFVVYVKGIANLDEDGRLKRDIHDRNAKWATKYLGLIFTAVQ